MVMTNISQDLLSIVFGPDSSGDAPEERARTSTRLFVRSQIQLAFDNPRAKGRRINAAEALDNFGWDTLEQLAYHDAVPIVIYEGEPGLTIEKRREQLGLTTDQLAHASGVSKDIIINAEKGIRAIPIRDLENIARFLSLDENQLGLQPDAGGDASLGVRLREVGGDLNANITKFSPSLVTGLSEAAWVIRKQVGLMKALDPDGINSPRKFGIIPDDNFNYPTWRHGGNLARKTREKLGLTPTQPIENLKEIIETRLAIPVVQAALPERFAGATIANGGQARGIVLNLQGLNTNVWVRRNTLAHELGHLLWDPRERLNQLRVDEFEELNRSPYVKGKDPVEIRANAFAVEFLAPQAAVRELFNTADCDQNGIMSVMDTYGISFTAAKWQIANSLNLDPGDLDVTGVDMQPSIEWMARENYTADYFPIAETPISRRGRFSKVLIDAFERDLISLDTVASCLGVPLERVNLAIEKIKSLF